MVVIERDVQFVGESVNDGGTDAKSSKRTWSGHESNFGKVFEIFTVFLEFIMKVRQKLFGEVVAEVVSVFFVI